MTETYDERRRRLNAAKVSAGGVLRIKQAFDLVHAQDKYRAEHPKEWADQVKKNTDAAKRRKVN
jgi:hypothetical protein